MKQEFALVGGFGAAGVGPFVAVTVLSPLRGHTLTTGVVVFLLIVAIAIAAVLAGPMIGAAATVNAGLWFNFLFVPPYGILKADDLLGWPTVSVVVAGLALVAAARSNRSSPDSGATPPGGMIRTEPGRPPSRHIERVVRLIEDGTDRRDLISAVQIELTSLLITRRCRFEVGTSGATGATTLPRLERDGTVSGATGEPERLQIPVQTATRVIGRFVVDLTPGTSISFERRLVAVILADHLAAALDARHTSSPRT